MPELLKLDVSAKDTLLEVLAHPRDDLPWQERVIYTLWFAYPIVLAAVVVAFGTLVLFFAAWRSRRVQEKRRRARSR